MSTEMSTGFPIAFIIIPIIFFVVFAIVAITIGIIAYKKRHQIEDSINSSMQNFPNPWGPPPPPPPAPQKRFCEYCGVQILPDTNQCNACGSKVTKRN